MKISITSVALAAMVAVGLLAASCEDAAFKMKEVVTDQGTPSGERTGGDSVWRRGSGWDQPVGQWNNERTGGDSVWRRGSGWDLPVSQWNNERTGGDSI